jgi:hypothetical protein
VAKLGSFGSGTYFPLRAESLPRSWSGGMRQAEGDLRTNTIFQGFFPWSVLWSPGKGKEEVSVFAQRQEKEVSSTGPVSSAESKQGSRFWGRGGGAHQSKHVFFIRAFICVRNLSHLCIQAPFPFPTQVWWSLQSALWFDEKREETFYKSYHEGLLMLHSDPTIGDWTEPIIFSQSTSKPFK